MVVGSNPSGPIDVSPPRVDFKSVDAFSRGVWFPSAGLVHSVNASVVAEDPVDRKHGGGVQVDGIVERIIDAARAAAETSPDPFRPAAALLRGLAVGHPFNGGNKRTAFIVAVALLAANGWRLELPEGEAASYMRTLTGSRRPEIDVEAWLRKASRKA